MPITPEQARAELARRELARRELARREETAVTPEVVERPNPIADILKTALGVGAGIGGAYGVKKGVGKIVGGVSEYPYRKTLAIREGLKKSQRLESKVYGRGLKTISKTSTEMVSPVSGIERMEEVLRNKGIIDKAGNKIGVPSNTIEAQYLKSRDILMNKFSNAKGGKVKIGDVIQEARNIKAKGGKFGTPKSIEASQLSDSLMEGVKPEIKSSEFKKIQTRYGAHRETMKPLEETFKPYENIYKTGKGEKVLGDIYSQPIGTQKALAKLPVKAGQTIKGAKIISRIKQVNPLNILRGKNFLGLLSGAPMILDILKFSRDPQGYMYEIETGRPAEELNKIKKLWKKDINELSEEETKILIKAGLIT